MLSSNTSCEMSNDLSRNVSYGWRFVSSVTNGSMIHFIYEREIITETSDFGKSILE